MPRPRQLAGGCANRVRQDQSKHHTQNQYNLTARNDGRSKAAGPSLTRAQPRVVRRTPPLREERCVFLCMWSPGGRPPLGLEPGTPSTAGLTRPLHGGLRHAAAHPTAWSRAAAHEEGQRTALLHMPLHKPPGTWCMGQGTCRRSLLQPCTALPPVQPQLLSLSALFIATSLPVIKVSLLCSVGAWCAAKGILPEDGRRVLSSLNFHIFTPCLFFSKLAGFGFSFCDPCLVPITLNMVLSHVVGAMLGIGVVRLARSPPPLHTHLILANAVGNIGNLPLVLVDSLSSGPGLALLGPSAALGVQYIMLGNVAGSCIQFPFISLALGHEGPAAAAGHGQQQQPQWDRLRQAIATPPLLAAFLALAVGQVPAVRAAFFSKAGALSLVGDIVHMLGDMTIPALMLVLGANLAKGPGAAQVPAASIAAAAVGRLVLLPLIGTALICCAHAAGWIQHLDPTALVVMMMMHAVPTALMVHSVATMCRNKEDEVAALLFWQYLACVVTLPAFMSLFLLVAARLCSCA